MSDPITIASDDRALVQKITDVLVSAGVIDSVRAADVVSMSAKPAVISAACGY